MTHQNLYLTTLFSLVALVSVLGVASPSHADSRSQKPSSNTYKNIERIFAGTLTDIRDSSPTPHERIRELTFCNLIPLRGTTPKDCITLRHRITPNVRCVHAQFYTKNGHYIIFQNTPRPTSQTHTPTPKPLSDALPVFALDCTSNTIDTSCLITDIRYNVYTSNDPKTIRYMCDLQDTTLQLTCNDPQSAVDLSLFRTFLHSPNRVHPHTPNP